MNIKNCTTSKNLIPVFLLLTCIIPVWSQKLPLTKPSPEQLAFQDLELGVFIHYSIDGYAERGAPAGSTPASKFNPTELNVEQWVLAAKDLGATYVVMTARHEQGFCLWPTSTTDYSIKSSPYKSGKGDIVREFVDVCRKHGMKPGLYTAPWIDSHWEANQPGYKPGDSGDINKLNDQILYDKALKKEKAQIRELMSDYGPLTFIWDDHFGRSDALDEEAHGGKFREFYAAFTQYAHELQPRCLLLGRDIEHVGNENSRAGYPLWNALNTLDGTLYSVSDTYKWGKSNTGNPEGRFYRPQLAPTTVAFSTGGWMWDGSTTRPRTPQPMQRMLQAYYETIGRGSGLLVNLTPDQRGLIPENLVVAAKEFGSEINRRFSNPIASSNSKDPLQVIRFSGPKTFDHVVTMEDLQDGQKIGNYIIEAEIEGQWRVIVEGQTVGHKRIDQFQPVTATALRFTVTKSVVQPAVIRSINIFNVSSN
jgi:alpha-L-fucosidase